MMKKTRLIDEEVRDLSRFLIGYIIDREICPRKVARGVAIALVHLGIPEDLLVMEYDRFKKKGGEE